MKNDDTPAKLDAEHIKALRRLYPMISDFVYFVRMEDDSMIEDGITKDAMLLVDPKDSFQNGNIVLVRFEGKTLVRRLYCREGYRLELRPANTNYPVRYADPLELELEGIVLNTIQKTS